MTRQTFGRWTLLGATALMMFGCGQPPDQFIIVQDQVPDPGCLIPTTRSSVYRATGVLDVSLVNVNATTGYAIFPLLQNNLPPPEGTQGRDPNRIALSSYNVDVNVMEDAPQETKDLFAGLVMGTDGVPDHMVQFSQPTSGSVDSGGGNTSSGVNAFPGELAVAIKNTGVFQRSGPFHIMSTIRAVGSTVTRSVTSDPFHFPILVCSGCLIANRNSMPTCPSKQAPQNTGNECNVAQDEAVDCCSTNSGALICPPVVAAP
jgi:hypothetical protein